MLKWQNMQGNEGLKKKVKICYIVTKGNWGGAQKYVYTLATNLPKDDYDSVVITGEGNTLRERLEEKGIKVYTLENLKRDVSVWSEIKSFFELLKIIKKEKPDVLHLNSPKAGGLGGLAGRILFIKKIIFTAHGWTFNEDRPLYQKFIILLLSWITIFLSHKTIVIAAGEEIQAKDLPLVNRRKIVLVRNGIPEINFKKKNIAREELSLLLTYKAEARAELWFGTIAELHRNKGLEYAIEAVSKIQVPFKYFIIGEGEERKNLESLIDKYNLREKVYLVGFVSSAEELLQAFDIFMLTSIKEGLPYTILEAGLASLPVIASLVGGVPDIIDNSVNGILTTIGRSGEIKRAIEYMVENPTEAKTFGKKLKEKVEKDFSVEQMMQKTLKLYN